MDFDKNLLWQEMRDAKTIAIAGHIRPDGDCIGSCLAMYNYISDNFGIAADVYIEDVPEEFGFLAGADKADGMYPDKPQNYDLFLALDCGSRDRLGKAEKYLRGAKRTVCIDHHETNEGYGQVNIIDGNAAATCELLCGLFEEEKISLCIAECLYTGIVHDTGVFKHSNTTRRTMECAGMLLEKGVNSTKVIDGTFYEKTYLQNQILGRCLMESVLCMDGKVIVSSVNRKVQLLYGLTPADTDGIIDQMRITKGVEVAILLKEMNPMVWRVSMRAQNYVDVAQVASKFGGGGHKMAAGCILNGSMHDVINTILKEIDVLI